MPAIDKLINAVRKGHNISAVRFSHLPDELHTVMKTRDGKVSLKLGKTLVPAELWLAKQTKRFRNFGPNTKGKLGPNSTTNINSVEIYLVGRGWIPLRSAPVNSPRKPKKLPAKTVAPRRRAPAAAPPSPERTTLVALGNTLQQLGAQMLQALSARG
jgi:hypothetical protein